jgi:hypothetical protein
MVAPKSFTKKYFRALISIRTVKFLQKKETPVRKPNSLKILLKNRIKAWVCRRNWAQYMDKKTPRQHNSRQKTQCFQHLQRGNKGW